MLLYRIIYDKQNLVNEILAYDANQLKLLAPILLRDPYLLIQDVIHFYFIKHFGVPMEPEYQPLELTKLLIPDMEPDEFALYTSNLMKGLIGRQQN